MAVETLVGTLGTKKARAFWNAIGVSSYNRMSCVDFRVVVKES
jgi:hypothetical protein